MAYKLLKLCFPDTEESRNVLALHPSDKICIFSLPESVPCPLALSGARIIHRSAWPGKDIRQHFSLKPPDVGIV
jgi:hypothetical protein